MLAEAEVCHCLQCRCTVTAKWACLGYVAASKADDEDVSAPSHALEAVLKVLATHQIHHHVHTLGSSRLQAWQQLITHLERLLAGHSDWF